MGMRRTYLDCEMKTIAPMRATIPIAIMIHVVLSMAHLL